MKLFEIKEPPSSWMLCEAAQGKNTHLEHIEDLVYNEGYLGAQRALNYMEGLRKMFARGEGAPVRVTVKWDGAPAIICGTDPADGKFFVGTKSVFAKTEPKVCKSVADINKFYSEQEGLATKLKQALTHLSKLGIGNVLQGDLLFTPGDVATTMLPDGTGDAEECYVFTPNTISYAVPVNSALGQRIAKAKLGIIFHTEYEGISLPSMQAKFGASVAGLNQTASVWFDDAFYKDLTGRASLTPEEDNKIKSILTSAATTFRKINEKDFNRIIFTGRIKSSGTEEQTEFAQYVKPFINSMVKSGSPIGNPTEFLNNFLSFYRGKMEEEIDKFMKDGEFTMQQMELVSHYMMIHDQAERKALSKQLIDAGIKAPIIARIDKIVEKELFMENNSNILLGILAIYKRIIEAKEVILSKMKQIENIGTFIKTDDGYKVTAPEGFVAIGHDGGAVKLVDRIEFSRANFTATKSWRKD